MTALNVGFDVEVDLWGINGSFYLGHDKPLYKIDVPFLNDKMWIHCKNLKAANVLQTMNLNWFWHQDDMMTITSKGYVWSRPGFFINDGITVECGKPLETPENILGVCTDYPIEWRIKLNEEQT